MSRRDFLKLISVLVPATLVACDRKLATAVAKTPTFAPTLCPTETATAMATNTAVAIPTVNNEAGIGARGGPLHELTLRNIEAGRYKGQVEGLKKQMEGWAKRGAITTMQGNQIIPLEDHNADPDGVRYTLHSPTEDAYFFPPLRIVPGEPPRPAYEVDNTPAPLMVYRIIKPEHVPELVRNHGLNEEMAQSLVGTTFELRGQQPTRVRNNKVVAYIGSQGRWVTEAEGVLGASKADARLCPVTSDAYESNAFLLRAMRNDESGPFTDKVTYAPLVIREKGGDEYIDYAPSETNPNPGEAFADPDKRMSRRAGYGFQTIDNAGNGMAIKAVKYRQKNGDLVWATSIDGNSLRGEGNHDFPMVSSNKFPDWVPPNVSVGLHQWVEDGDIPKTLNFKKFHTTR